MLDHLIIIIRATIAFYQHEGSLAHSFRIYDHNSAAAQQNKYDTQHAHFLCNAQRVSLLTLRNSPLDRFYSPKNTPAQQSLAPQKCLVCHADGFPAQASCITPICYSCRTQGVYCACMEQPKGLTQVYDDVSGQTASAYVTVCTGLKVRKCPNTPNKLPAFLSNTPFHERVQPNFAHR